MANKDKVNLKISIFQDEIGEYEKQIENLKEQKGLWMGYEKASKESLETINQAFKEIKEVCNTFFFGL